MSLAGPPLPVLRACAIVLSAACFQTLTGFGFAKHTHFPLASGSFMPKSPRSA